jgi:hypothetical protein
MAKVAQCGFGKKRRPAETELAMKTEAGFFGEL